MSCVYALTDSRGVVRYVGKTSGPPAKRLREHLAGARRGLARQRHLYCWLRSLASPPSLLVLEKDPDDLNAAERTWITFFRRQRIPLCNMTDGGDGQSAGYVPSETARAKVSASLIGRPVSEAAHVALSSQWGTARSSATREKIRARAIGRRPANKRVWTDDLRARALAAYSRLNSLEASRELGVGHRQLRAFLREQGVMRKRHERAPATTELAGQTT